MPGDLREIKLALSQSARARLLEPEAPPRSPHFGIRYAVPPDTLNPQINDLSLRKTVRGEYIVEEQAEAEAKPEPKLGKPMFRGPGQTNKETECVLLYNPKLKQYELHFMDLEMSVAPALKSRSRPTSHGADAPTSANAGLFHQRTHRQSSVQALNHSVVNHSVVSVGAPEARRQASITPKVASPAPAPLKAPTAAKPVPAVTPKAPVSPKAPAAPKAIARAPAKAAARNSRLPTRRKIAKPKPVDPPSDDEDVSSMSSSLETPSVMAVMRLPRADAQAPAAPSPEPVLDSQFEADFNDLADELADDLMEDSEEEEVAPKRLVGTAGGSAEDGDDSSEEE